MRGLRHIQMEPVWGGQADSAATLRGTCALALIDCQLDELIERKRSGPEKGHLNEADFAFHESEYLRLTRLLEDEARAGGDRY